MLQEDLNLKPAMVQYESKLLKKTIDKIVDPITYNINLTFDTGTFPTDLKCAKVIPIHKSRCNSWFLRMSDLRGFSVLLF